MTEPKQILFVVHSEYPLREVRVQRQAVAAAEAGWAVDVLTLSYDGRPAGSEVVDGVRVAHTAVRRLRDYSVAGLVREYLPFAFQVVKTAARAHRYDVVVVANPPDFLLHAALGFKLRGAKLVFDVHDFSTDLFAVRSRGWRGRLMLPALAAVERSALRLADRVLTVHGPYAEEVTRRTGGRVRADVMMNAADTRLFVPRSELPEGRPTVMYHGTLAERYGVLDVIRAFAGVRKGGVDARLWVLGGGDAAALSIAEAASSGIGEDAWIPGEWLPVEAMAEYIAAATLGVIPNRPNELNRFALSTKLFEYVATGVPVVCADLPTLRDHFAADELLFFRAGDAGDLERALAWALTHPADMAARAQKALARYEQRYSWSRQRDAFLAILDGLASGSGVGTR